MRVAELTSLLSRPIALVGMPGSGKSTVGRLLARRLGWEFADSDQLIESRAGSSIRSIFEERGELAFRALEAEALKELSSSGSLVIATGGGAVVRLENRILLCSRTTVTYLHATPDELARRLKKDTKRPLLQVADPLARLQQLYESRDSLYREVAQLIIEPGRQSAVATSDMLLMQLQLAKLVDSSK